MKNRLSLILLIGALLLFALAFMFYQKSKQLETKADSLRVLTMPISTNAESAPLEPAPKPAYDPTDLDQTPPGVTPFNGTSICFLHWGNHLRQYCEGGDKAALELAEGSVQAETMRVLTMCLNEMIQRTDAYHDRNMRPMDSKVPLNEENRKTYACDMTEKYGDSPVFANSSVYYIAKEHMESGNISRLENR